METNAEAAITGVILAGGKSTRFGSDKAAALLLGRPMLQWSVSALGAVCDELVVVVAKDQVLPAFDAPVPVKVSVDAVEGLGPLAGLVTGLSAVTTQLCFAVSCDAPLIRPELISALASLAPDYDVVCPYVGGFIQPLAAVYRPATCVSVFAQFVERGLLKVTAAFGPLRTKVVREDELSRVDPGLESFLNANRPEMLDELAAIASRRLQR